MYEIQPVQQEKGVKRKFRVHPKSEAHGLFLSCRSRRGIDYSKGERYFSS